MHLQGNGVEDIPRMGERAVQCTWESWHRISPNGTKHGEMETEMLAQNTHSSQTEELSC